MTLKARSSPSTQTTGRPRRSTIDGAVGGIAGALVERLPQHRQREALRRLNGAQGAAVERLRDAAVRPDALDGIGERQRGHGPLGARAQGRDDAIDDLGRHQRPRGVVHEHEVRALRYARQPGCHGVGARGASGHGGSDLGRREVVGQQRRAFLVLLRHDHDDAVDQVVIVEHRERPGEHRPPAQAHERLGTIGAQPLAGARCNHDGPDLAGHGAQEASRVKIILPLGDCSTLVTSVSTSSPMWSRAPSTTIIVPSSR